MPRSYFPDASVDPTDARKVLANYCAHQPANRGDSGGPTLRQLAGVARLSPYYFARQFKRATGLPPHQYVIRRRVERAKHLLQAGTDLSLAEVAARRLLGPEPVLPSLQAARRRRAGAVPNARKKRLTGRKPRQETAE